MTFQNPAACFTYFLGSLICSLWCCHSTGLMEQNTDLTILPGSEYQSKQLEHKSTLEAQS